MVRPSLALATFSAFLSTLACDGGTGPAPVPRGDLRVIAETDGFEIDTDGYSVRVDGGAVRALPANGFFLAENLSVGDHSIEISGLAGNCTLQGANPRTASVLEDATTDVALVIDCAWPDPPAVVGIVNLQGRPYGAAVSATGVIYVALIGSSHLQRGTLSTMSFGSTVTVGSTPPHVAFTPDGHRVYSTLQWGQGVAVVDVASNSLVTVIPLRGDGFNLIVSGNGERVYATDADGRLYRIDTATNAIIGEPLFVGAAANGLVFSPDGSTLYVTARDAGTVTAVSTSSFTITRTYIVGGMPQRIAISPDGGTLYVANEVSGLNVVNVVSGHVASYSFGTPAYGLGISKDGRLLYALLAQAGVVVVIERATLRIVTVLEAGGIPRNITFDASGETALVTTEEAVVFIR